MWILATILHIGIIGLFFYYFKIIPKSKIGQCYSPHRENKYSIVSNKWIYMEDKQMNAMVDMFIEMGEKKERYRQGCKK